MKRDLTRREFIHLAALSTAGAILAGCLPEQALPTDPLAEAEQDLPVRVEPTQPGSGDAYLAVTHGADPAQITKAALSALGGIERFVKQGADVIIKPNICTDYHPPEYASTTNPTVVATLVSLALGAGARRVRVMDYPFGGSPRSAYASSGIADAVQAAGGEMHVMSQPKYVTYQIPGAKSLKSTQVYPDVMEADVLINVPIAKHHNSARLTLGAKNLMGVVLNRGSLHADLHKRIADLASLVRPTLTVIDAVRILMDHGPTGGDLNDVKQMDTVIASHDLVCADAYAASLFGKLPRDVPYIEACADLGLGQSDWQAVSFAEISL